MLDGRLRDARLLQATAAVIERDGLNQGGFGSWNGPKCLLSSFAYVLRMPCLRLGLGPIFSYSSELRELGEICRRTGLARAVPRPALPADDRDLAVWMAAWSDSVGHQDFVVWVLRRVAAGLESLADADTMALDLAIAWPTGQPAPALSSAAREALVA